LSGLFNLTLIALPVLSAATDLLIGGIEASLWIAEQWAADLRTIFPQLNVVTVSANKLLGLGSSSAFKAFFPGTDTVLPRRINENTCVLMISQSGQTFPTLHATRKLSRQVKDKMWLLTGCFGSKMEQAMVESYKEMVSNLLYHSISCCAVPCCLYTLGVTHHL
jgi:hypothetical protein